MSGSKTLRERNSPISFGRRQEYGTIRDWRRRGIAALEQNPPTVNRREKRRNISAAVPSSAERNGGLPVCWGIGPPLESGIDRETLGRKPQFTRFLVKIVIVVGSCAV
jgi:hypothetical protein